MAMAVPTTQRNLRVCSPRPAEFEIPDNLSNWKTRRPAISRAPSWLSLDVRAMGNQALGARSRSGQLHSQRNLALIAQDTELHSLVFVLRFALRGKFLAQVANRPHALAVDRDDGVAGFYSGFFRG